jgi:hypothetical protein
LARLGQVFKHLSNGSTVLGIQIGVNLVEEVERGWIALLDGKDKG